MDPPYSEMGLLYVPNIGRLAKVNFYVSSLRDSYYLGVSAIPTAQRAG